MTSLDPSFLLLFAAALGKFEMVKHLLQRSANVDFSDPETGLTAMHYVAMNGHIAIAKYLLVWHAQINVSDRSGWTPLHYARLQSLDNMCAWLEQQMEEESIAKLDNVLCLEKEARVVEVKDDYKEPLESIPENHIFSVKLLRNCAEGLVENVLQEIQSGVNIEITDYDTGFNAHISLSLLDMQRLPNVS